MSLLSSIVSAFRGLPLAGRVAFFLAWGWLCVSMAWFFEHTYDDVYITLRYAENLAAGRGFVFNPGEHVEGASNLLWVLILAAAAWGGFDPLLAAKLLGGALVLLVPWLQLALCEKLTPGRVNPAAPWLTALSAPVAFWAVNGLETGAYTFLLTWGLLVAAADLERREGWPWAALIFLAAALIRPEGVLMAVSYVVLLLWQACRGRTVWVKPFRVCAVLGIGLGILTAWRLVYFGQLLPNTFYAKVANPALWSPVEGWSYLRSTFEDSGGIGWCLVALLPFLLKGAQPIVAWLLAGTLLCQLGFILYVHGDWMLGARFVVPVLPAFYVLAGGGLGLLWSLLRRGSIQRFCSTAALVIMVAFTLALAFRERSHLAARIAPYTNGMRSGHLTLARWLRLFMPPGTVMALSDVGVLPYVSRLPVIDLLGLTDKFIARHEPAESAEYVLIQRKPELIILAVADRKVFFFMNDHIGFHPEFARAYIQYCAVPFLDYNLHLFMRKAFYQRWKREYPMAGLPRPVS